MALLTAESAAPDAGIAATNPNAAVEHCRAAAATTAVTGDSCAYCYAALALEAAVPCLHCGKRKLCSATCQELDWKVVERARACLRVRSDCIQRRVCRTRRCVLSERDRRRTLPTNQVHRHFCGVAGEKNVDWAVRDCSEQGKGFGVVALRDFDFGEIIMAERCVASCPEEIGELAPASVRAAAMLLVLAPSTPLFPSFRFFFPCSSSSSWPLARAFRLKCSLLQSAQ
jgi:hypothetical protein